MEKEQCCFWRGQSFKREKITSAEEKAMSLLSDKEAFCLNLKGPA